MPIRLFLSYRFQDQEFVSMVYRYLCAQRPEIDPYFYSHESEGGRWNAQLRQALGDSSGFVLFVSDTIGRTQAAEKELAFIAPGIEEDKLLWVRLSKQKPRGVKEFTAGMDAIDLVRDCRAEGRGQLGDAEAHYCARQITRRLGAVWKELDDVPEDYLFDYEKDIIETFRRQHEQRLDPRIPASWPQVQRAAGARPNPLPSESIGEFRPDTARVIVDARSGSLDDRFTLPEAGPRERLCYPTSRHPNRLEVGVLVSGGIAPGVNAVIAGIVNRHHLYARPPGAERESYQVHIRGYLEGFKALLRDGEHYKMLRPEDVKDQAQLGGSMIATARADELLDASPAERVKATEKIVTKLASDGIEILYVIGGDGSMRAAHAIWTVARKVRPELNLSVVGVPKTMDNDILWVWQAFGFLSAVEKAREIIAQLRTEAHSNPRLCVIQLFGSDSGFVVAHAVLASGGCDYALIPEVGFTMKTLVKRIKELLARRLREEKRAYGMIVMSETAIPRDALDYADVARLDEREQAAIRAFLQPHVPGEPARRRVHGQTPDELRSAGLKIVSRVLQEEIRELDVDPEYFEGFRVFTNEPRHIIRAISPSVSDIVLGQRLGTLAVDNALAGYTDFMVSQWLTEFVLVPLKLVVLGRKRVPRKGIFWKSVLASTRQPSEEDLPE